MGQTDWQTNRWCTCEFVNYLSVFQTIKRPPLTVLVFCLHSLTKASCFSPEVLLHRCRCQIVLWWYCGRPQHSRIDGECCDPSKGKDESGTFWNFLHSLLDHLSDLFLGAPKPFSIIFYCSLFGLQVPYWSSFFKKWVVQYPCSNCNDLNWYPSLFIPLFPHIFDPWSSFSLIIEKTLTVIVLHCSFTKSRYFKTLLKQPQLLLLTNSDT